MCCHQWSQVVVVSCLMCPSCELTGYPACHPQTSEHGGPVPASDVRSPAAAPHAADSSPAAAPAHAPPAESGHHTAGQAVSVITSAKEVIFSAVTVFCWLFGLSAGLHKKTTERISTKLDWRMDSSSK